MSKGGGDFVKTYEVMYIVKPIEEEAVETIIKKFQDLITKNGGTVEKTDRWGKKHLAYEIQDFAEGYYVIVNFKAEPAAEKELDRVMKITDEVLRHMIILKAE
jgi:small subunit ribosomal protein S6